MRVLLVTHYYAEHRGGVEIVAAELARRLADRRLAGRGNGVEIVWVASAGPGDASFVGRFCKPSGGTDGLQNRPTIGQRLVGSSPSAQSAASNLDGIRRLPVRAWNFTERRLGFPYPVWSPLTLLGLGQ